MLHDPKINIAEKYRKCFIPGSLPGKITLPHFDGFFFQAYKVRIWIAMATMAEITSRGIIRSKF